MIYQNIVYALIIIALLIGVYFLVIKKLLYKNLSARVDQFRKSMQPGTPNLFLKVFYKTNKGLVPAFTKCEILRITKFSTAPYLVRFKGQTNTNGSLVTKNVKHTDLYPEFAIPKKYQKKDVGSRK